MEQTTILDELEREGYVVIPIRGISMRPLLHEDSTHVLIRRLEDRPEKNDVLLYVRPDGTQVLHAEPAKTDRLFLFYGGFAYG